MNREAIYSALWDRVKAVPGFRTTSRVLQHWAEVPAAKQPALFLTCGNQTRERVGNGLYKWRLAASLYVYVNTGGSKSEARPPSAILNDLLDAIQEALAPPPGSIENTLGGLVQRAGIVGEITTDEGVLGEQAVAVVPVEILVAEEA